MKNTINRQALKWEVERLEDHMDKYDSDFLNLVKNKIFTEENIAKRLANYKVIRNFSGNGHLRINKLKTYLRKHGYKKRQGKYELLQR